MYSGYYYGANRVIGGRTQPVFSASYRVGQTQIISSMVGDVTGDGISDRVYLTAIKSEDPPSAYLKEITLNIQDGVTNQVFVIPLNANGNAGYNPTVFLGDFTSNGIQDIMIVIDSGGSGAFTFDYIYSFVNNEAQKLFDYEQYNALNQYEVNYLDGYKVEIVSHATGKSYLIDISNRGTDYLTQLYIVDGTLKKPIQGWADGISGFYPVDMDRNGVYEIQAYQQLSGLYHADSLGYIINTLQWDGQKFTILQQWLAIFGANES